MDIFMAIISFAVVVFAINAVIKTGLPFFEGALLDAGIQTLFILSAAMLLTTGWFMMNSEVFGITVTLAKGGNPL